MPARHWDAAARAAEAVPLETRDDDVKTHERMRRENQSITPRRWRKHATISIGHLMKNFSHASMPYDAAAATAAAATAAAATAAAAAGPTMKIVTTRGNQA